MQRARVPVVLLFALAAASAGCITRPVSEKVFDDGYTSVMLRTEKRGFTAVPKGYEHPAVISPVRMAHILSRIDLRWAKDENNERVPAIPLDTLFIIAKGMVEALEKANPDQAVVVMSIRRDRHLAIFERQFLTSLIAYMQDDLLYIHLSRPDWEIPPRRKEDLPEPSLGDHPLKFRLVVDRGMTLGADHQSVAVQWRDEIFRKATRTRVTSTGRVVRREVLMESLEDETVFEKPAAPPADNLSPEQLRALADLEEARQNGEVTETEYTGRRDKILRGELN
jgi:hypothetical protein